MEQGLGGELGAAVGGLEQGCWSARVRTRGNVPQQQELEFSLGMWRCLPLGICGLTPQ